MRPVVQLVHLVPELGAVRVVEDADGEHVGEEGHQEPHARETLEVGAEAELFEAGAVADEERDVVGCEAPLGGQEQVPEGLAVVLGNGFDGVVAEGVGVEVTGW